MQYELPLTNNVVDIDWKWLTLVLFFMLLVKINTSLKEEKLASSHFANGMNKAEFFLILS